MPEGSSQPLLCFPIEGRDWSDGWQRSKLHEAAWRWSTAEEGEEERFAAVEAASLSCTTTGDRLIRCGSDRGNGDTDDGKSTGLFRILISAKQKPTRRFTHPKPILKFQISNKTRYKERKIKKGIHKPIYSYCIYMPLQTPRKKIMLLSTLFSLSLSLSISHPSHTNAYLHSLSLSIYLSFSIYIASMSYYSLSNFYLLHHRKGVVWVRDGTCDGVFGRRGHVWEWHRVGQ